MDYLFRNMQRLTKNNYLFRTGYIVILITPKNKTGLILLNISISGNNVMYLPLRLWILHLKQETNFI